MISDAAALARRLVETLGGRYSAELGIDVDAGSAEVECWFVAATLFGNRISASIAARTYRTLVHSGVRTIADVELRSWEELVALLDAGGYVRYDFRTATRLKQLAAAVQARYGGRISALQAESDPASLEKALDALPGWGPTTVGLFLRELRGVWPAAKPRLDERVRAAGRHLGLLEPGREQPAALQETAYRASLDVRDVETALVRLAMRHGRAFTTCPGGVACQGLA